MIITSSESIRSFNVMVKLPAYHPSEPGSIPARVTFYIFFYLVLRPFKMISFIASRLNRKVGRRTPKKSKKAKKKKKKNKTPDYLRVERLVPHVTRARLESSAVICS